jgi:hypothetical protein
MANPVLGQQQPTSAGSQFNAISFIIQQLTGQMATAALVQVKAVTNAGGLAPSGMVDVQPMVSQIDGAGNGTPHGTINGLPYFRIQGGANAVIIDPQVGDIGIAVFASTDISAVKATKAPATPGSRRRFDWADGLYIGGLLNGEPSQYIQFSEDGISIKSSSKITLTDGAGSIIVLNNDNTGEITASGGLTINSNLQVNGQVVATGEGTFNGSHTVSQHTHTQGNDSSGDVEQPTNKPIG